MAGEMVLIIEDDPVISRGLNDNFKFKGYLTRTEHDGKAGLDAALETQPDLIILDIMLPNLNGYEICRRIREANLDMPIIMLSARGNEEGIVHGLNMGANDYVTKPFSVRELLARANAFLRQRREALPENYYFGDCEVQLSSHKLFRAGSEVELTPKEYGLLAFFIERHGRALTRDEIMRHVWGSDLMVTPRSVDRCINTLRQKLEPNPPRPMFIKTIRDVGYRFEVPDQPEPPTETGPDTAAANLSEGSQISGYVLSASLGTGPMGQVFKARHLATGQDVVVRILPHNLKPELLAKLERDMPPPELSLILRVVSEKPAHTIMPLFEGENLATRLRRGSLEQAEALSLAIDIAEQLAGAHGNGFFHLNLRPSSVFPSPDGPSRLLDWGMAALDTRSGAQSGGFNALSTLVAYMSPERLRGQPGDGRSDIFSLGCIMHEMLNGQKLFGRETLADTMVAVLKDKPDPLEPRALDRIVQRCLAKAPEGRFQSASDLAFALQCVA